jgi:hypothetical protein
MQKKTSFFKMKRNYTLTYKFNYGYALDGTIKIYYTITHGISDEPYDV